MTVLLIYMLFCGLVACGGEQTSSPVPKEKEIDYAKTPLRVDSESAGGGNKPDIWNSFHCLAHASASTSLFDLDNVTLTLTFDGDFSDEYAAKTFEWYTDIEYCDLSAFMIRINSAFSPGDRVGFFQTNVPTYRKDDYVNGQYSKEITICKEFFIFKLGVIHIWLLGETYKKGQLTPCTQLLIIGYEKRGDQVVLSQELAQEFREQGSRFFDFPWGENFNVDLRPYFQELSEAEEYYYSTLFEKQNYSGLILDKTRGKGVEMDPSCYSYYYALRRGEGSNEEKYYLSEDVKIEYYFGGVDGTREQYEYVEICFADPDRLDRGLFTYKRIDDYDSAEYACDKVFSLDGEVLYINYHHHETVTIPKDFPLDKDRGKLCLLLIGKVKGEDRFERLSGLTIDYTNSVRKYIDGEWIYQQSGSVRFYLYDPWNYGSREAREFLIVEIDVNKMKEADEKNG